MKSFLQSLSHLGSRLPEIILIVTILAVVVVLLLTFLTTYAVKRATKKGPTEPKEKPLKERIIPEYRMPPIGGRLSQFLSLRGIFRVGDISVSFLRALAFLRGRLDNLTYKYQLPWYLMVGASASGKSTLLESAGMSLPVGMPTFGLMDSHPACRWWFYNRAVVLDIHGSLFIEEHKTAADERGWRTILSLLGRYRSKRPLDGIILTISAAELYGRERLSPENINARAKFLSQKLVAAQHLLGLRLPVYVIVTKCDFLPGFQSFCHELPLVQRHNMLGWSVPYALHSAYTPHWVDEAFHTIAEDLSSVQLEMYAHGVSEENQDGIFVLPDEFFSMKNNLKLYLDHIFKSSAYEESLMLRGIYFCGDSGQVPAGISMTEDLAEETTDNILKADLTLSTQTQPIDSESLRLWDETFDEPMDRKTQARLSSPESSQYLDAIGPHICFAKDIFEDKIFFESGLAYPIYSRLVSANRNINLAKAGMVAFVGIGTFGMFNAYDNFTKNRDFLMPVLGKVSSVLTQLPPPHSGEMIGTEAQFEHYAKSLLDMMHHVHRTSFFSFFIPSSWFSPLQDHLNNSLKISYEQIILRTIYMDLLLKTRDLLNTRPGNSALGPQQKTTAISALLMPIVTTEFHQIKAYVEQMDKLIHNINKYNELRESPSATLLAELVEYTFDMQLPPEFSDSYQRIIKILQEAPYPPIDIKAYYGIAQSTLNGLYTNFLNLLFSPVDPMSLIGQLRYLTKSMEKDQFNQPINLEHLRDFINGLAQSLPSLGASGHNWIDGNYFDPGPEFSTLMAKIDELPAFGPAFVDQLAKQTSVVYTAFHKELLQMNRSFSNPTSATTHKPTLPSEGIFNLEKVLNKLFNEPFMAKTNGETIVTQIPENKVVSFDQKFIADAISLIQRYETFVEKDLDSFPLQLKETFKKIAFQNLQLNVISDIAKAQSFSELPKSLQLGDANEELLRSQVGDIKVTVPQFLKLLETLNNVHSGTVFVELQNILGIMSSRLLEKVDALLISYHPYSVRENSFDWWGGKTPVFLEGFNVKDSDELKSYLAQQRQLISHLAIDYAQPLITLLTSDIMKAFVSRKALINRWRRIVEQLSLYDKRLPDNTVTALENFIENDAAGITMANCFEKLSLKQVRNNSGDFFLDRHIQLQRALMSRCEVGKRKDAIKNYEQLVSQFNESFKDKFPFVGENASQSQGEVDPADIKSFFSLYHDFGDSPKNILDQVYQLGDPAKEAYQFLKDMEALKEFFHTFLTSKLPGDVPTFDFEIDFRVNKDHETGGNMIIDWSLSPSENVTISNTSKSKNGRWSYGNPVVAVFRWPDSAETSPFADKAQPFMEVDEQTVTYTYPGQWSIFWMLRSQQATSDDFDNMKDSRPYTLRYEIPNGAEEKTIVYNRITFHKPAKGKKLGAILKVPSFPTDAPGLDQKILDMADKPVIVQGLVEIAPEIKDDIENKEKEDKKKGKKKAKDDDEEPAAEEKPEKKGKGES